MKGSKECLLGNAASIIRHAPKAPIAMTTALFKKMLSCGLTAFAYTVQVSAQCMYLRRNCLAYLRLMGMSAPLSQFSSAL